MALYPHGTLAKYAQGCPCGLCALAHSLYYPAPKRTTSKDRKQVPAAPVRDHLRDLIDNGWTQTAIAARSGYSKQQIHKILTTSTHTDPLVAEDLMGVGA